jgi:hypothetical protein
MCSADGLGLGDSYFAAFTGLSSSFINETEYIMKGLMALNDGAGDLKVKDATNAKYECLEGQFKCD